MGAPDFLSVDQGSAYVSREMKETLSAAGVTLEEAPVETPGAIGIVKRYHSPLRSAYAKIRDSLSNSDNSDAECLNMAVFAINSIIGPEGLCSMMLVFGSLPRPALTIPAPTQLQRQVAIERAREAATKDQSKRRISFALRHTGGPKAREHSERLRNLPSGSPVLVYRSTSRAWEGPFRYISIDGETVVVQLERGRRIFRSTCVKPWQLSDLPEEQGAQHPEALAAKI